MLTFNLLVFVCLCYVAFLFAVAFAAERRARRGRRGWLRSPAVYTLSLSIYCTAWTFYGAVGYAARSGLEFVTIYLGPTLVLVGWWTVLRKLVRIGRAQRLTSVADLISSRYGKSNSLGVIVTVLALVGTTPYIALQLQSVTLSFAVFSGDTDLQSSALWVAIGLAAFTILFGTRSLDVNERHDGVVIAIAVEAVVKLVALLAVGIFVTFAIAGGPAGIAAMIETSEIADWDFHPSRWLTLTFLSAAAFLTLPRMFHVLVVENGDERHLATASWAFPLYLFAMSLFVVPIAVVGLAVRPGTNPDLFVLTVPLAYDRDGLAMLSFLGGFSSATSMVIVAAIAVSTMVSNHIVMPIFLRSRRGGASVSGDVREVVLTARRISIAAILFLGWCYYRLSGGGTALAQIGIISFAGVAQAIPALLGAIFWRGATRVGATAGLVTGFAVWLWTMLLPSVGDAGLLPAAVLADGPFGLSWLRPRALFGVEGMDPTVHAVFWSISLNTLAFLAGSFLSFPRPLERLQGAAFVGALSPDASARGWEASLAGAEDLLIMAQRILGPAEAQAHFAAEARRQGKDGFLPDVTPGFLERLERLLSGSVGAATAHAMLTQITGGATVSVEDLMRVAGEAQQIMEHSSQLEAKSEELARTAGQLREANAKLIALAAQKDAFLAQVSHELRTPMTSIRSFSELLRGAPDLTDADRARFHGVIHAEAIRLTRLLDDLIDLNVLENGQVSLSRDETTLERVLDLAETAAIPPGGLTVVRDRTAEAIPLTTDTDRLAQVFINVMANAQKYCDADAPRLTIRARDRDGAVTVDFVDNGSGIPADRQDVIFEKFTRATDARVAGSAGLGLAICRELATRLGGRIEYLPGQGGAAFRVVLPSAARRAA